MTKPYKCRVEYLESDSTAYIDTGVSGANNNLKIEMGFSYSKFTAYGYFFSNYESETANVTRFCLNGTDTNWGLAYINTKSQDGAIYTSNFTKDTFHTFVLTKTSVSIDESTRTNDNPPSGTANTKNIILFNRGSGSYADKRDVGMRCYYFRIYDTDVLVRDFIPVLDNSGRPAMYDQVSGQLFYNQGSGDDFTYGRQIIPVEYLYTGDDINCGSSSPFTSTSYRLIDTKETIDLTSVVEIKFAFDKNIYFSGCGARNNSSNMTQSVYFPACYSTQDKFGWTIGSGEEQRQKFTLDTNDHTIRVDLPNSNVVWDDVSYPIANLTYTPSERTFPLFAFSDVRATQDNGYRFPMQGKIYYAKFWKNGVLTKDFIPAIDENGVGFMFDKVQNTVYLNAGTGQFKVGPNVEKSWSGKKLRRKLALALANLKKKRRYYCEVEYLESTGTQWIDTGIAPSNITPIAKMKFIPTQQYSSGSYGIFGCFGANNTRFQVFYNSIGIGTYVSKSWQANTTYEVELNGKVPSATINGNVETSGYSNANGFSSDNMYLFTRNNGNVADSGVPLKLYYCKIWDNGTLVRDMIPVLDWNYVPCMFDRVSEQLFYNAGTGNFTAGREIHPVDYLESTGVEYVDTGIKFDGANTKIELKTYEDSLTRRHSICGDDGNFFYYFRGTGNWAVGYNGTAANIDSYMSVGDNVFVMDKNNVYVNGVLAKTYTASSAVSSYNALLFNRKTSLVDNGAVTMYYCKIWNNNVLVRDYIPAIDENGVGYMLDRVSHTIYDNAGTGAFGYSGREVEYLQSDGARAILAGVTVDDTCGYDVKWMALNANDRIIMGTKGSGESRWVLSGSNNPNVNLSWNTSFGSNGLGLNKIQTAQMNYLNDRKRILNDTPLEDITTTLSSAASTYNIGIFAGYWGATTISLYSTCRIYYAKITKGTELIRDFVPMVKDGSPCLFDKVGGVYYFGTGTGTFTRGKIVEPEYE